MNSPRGKVRVAALAILFAILSALLGITILSAPMASSRSGAVMGEFPPPPRHMPMATPAGPLRQSRSPVSRPASESVAIEPSITSGTWTPLNNQPSFLANGAFLLTDGRILVQDGDIEFDTAWWTLTPDNLGSYINGTWTQVAAPSNCPNGYPGESADKDYAPLYYASAVLADGRFVVIGGEYNHNYSYVPRSGFEVWTDQGAIYDPVANSWTCISAPTGWTQIGDAQSVVLPNGTFMVAHPFTTGTAGGNEVATLDVSTNPPSFKSPINPTGKSADVQNDEEGWELLPKGTVLTLEVWNSNSGSMTPALTYNSATTAWSSAGHAPQGLVQVDEGGSLFAEIGPALLRPDGTVFAAGATGFNDIYNTGGGTWSSGPTSPTIADAFCSGAIEQLVAADAPAALLPDGNVLIAESPLDPLCSGNVWVPPTALLEFDGTNLTQVNAPPNASNDASYFTRLLTLPTGQVLFTDTSNDVEIYTPAGTPNAAWAPTISNSPASVSPGGANYMISGTQFNGLSQAVSYGDDYQAATNYPLVRITNNATGDVFYARTHNHSTMAVATGGTTVSTEFDVSADTELGASTLVVVANGIESASVAVTVTTPVATPTATATETPVPDGLKITPTSVNFGKVPMNGHHNETIVLTNTASHGPPITLNSISVTTSPQIFELLPTTTCHAPGQLLPTKSCKLKMGFFPIATGLQTDTVTIIGNEKNGNKTIPLKGTGIP